MCWNVSRNTIAIILFSTFAREPNNGQIKTDWGLKEFSDIFELFRASPREYRGGRRSRGSRKGWGWSDKRTKERKVCKCLWGLLWLHSFWMICFLLLKLFDCRIETFRYTMVGPLMFDAKIFIQNLPNIKRKKKYLFFVKIWSSWCLSASPWKVVDQIEEVECHQQEGKHEK